MITGHFATALVPYAKNKSLPLLPLLLVTQIQDFLIPLDIWISGERDFAKLEMTHSHDLVPVLMMTIIVSLVMHLIYKNKVLTMWTAGLIIFHEICDLFAGFAHNVWGLDTPRLGFDFYRSAPLNAFIIEFVLAALCCGYFLYCRHKQNDALGVLKTSVLLTAIFLPILGAIAAILSGNPLF